MNKAFKHISLAKECESPENPGALEKRVALMPSEVKKLVPYCEAFAVESGAGEKLEISDQEYIDAGATIVDHKEVYTNKDLIIKFKGPSLESIPLMKPHTTLFCMAHFSSYPERAELLKNQKINVLAMEWILESPKVLTDEIILAKVAMEQYTKDKDLDSLNIIFLGYHPRLVGAIRRAGNRKSKTLSIFKDTISLAELTSYDKSTLFVYDSKTFKGNSETVLQLEKDGFWVEDLSNFEEIKGKEAISNYRQSHPPFEYGLRRIQCLHETGMAGARYGLKLLKEESNIENDFTVSVMGYGNVGMGAIDECYSKGAKKINILGSRNTTPENIEPFLKESNLIVNGAELPESLRGKVYLLKKEHTKNILQKGSVVIDLIGGSATNRSAVEDVVACSFLTDPHFERNGIFFSSLWGWPMMGMNLESAKKYSSQIFDVLINREKVIKGLDLAPRNIQKAIVCGPF